MEKRRVILIPLDPVHDIGLKVIKRGLEQLEHNTILLPPDLSTEELIQQIIEHKPDVVLVSRTIGYGVVEILGKFIDLLEASGLRNEIRVGIGGKAITPELAAELGFDAGFGPGTTIEEAVAFVEEREYTIESASDNRVKKDVVRTYDYKFKNKSIEKMLDYIVDSILDYVQDKTSPAVIRARIRRQILESNNENEKKKLKADYSKLCDEVIKGFYESHKLREKTRSLNSEELRDLSGCIERVNSGMSPLTIQHVEKNPVVFIQYGTGCPFMDIAHIKACEAWGADGVIHFDPSWGARTEGLLEGYITHEEDGTKLLMKI